MNLDISVITINENGKKRQLEKPNRQLYALFIREKAKKQGLKKGESCQAKTNIITQRSHSLSIK